ncbi:ABC transporter family substrate-binding protein [Corynebacterium guangdongense]|uniref:Solute-binding protein family 5 domain-containing protein n=1 Tax=Corynebacterium guangdongense TaxID=1783348 RepID=A0ABU1ZW78_9CORY|nr:ABC transporter substrate-binding protein [Corynebacterium guangdongense]MDR7329015.1 hypothetical protein [Corynebacterium guangdongense]WJZ17585.1 putative monoacyl phosphatidylinositol tetramannoside-binding protein LpqW precursor [Corynebacterium guangdongense]
MKTAGIRAATTARLAIATLGAAAVLLTSACVAQPGPAPTVEPEPTPSTSPASSAEPTTSASETPTTPRDSRRSSISVGVAPLLNGFNPHLLSDNNATVESIAKLVLPSVFRDGQLDTDLMVSAQEVEPVGAGYAQTVRYVISPTAQWSDGTPITGADFIYLWESMTRTPAVIDRAGYAAVSDVRTSDGGKTVHVSFAEPFPEWRELFTHLLPSHLAAPGGEDFATVLFDTIPASAGRFMVAKVDRARGVFTLHRNDRYWGQAPARTDVLSLIEVQSSVQGSDLLRSGQVSFLDVVPSEVAVQSYDLVPGTETRMITGPRQLELTLSTASPVLAEHQRRRELLGLLAPETGTITRLAAGRSADVLPAPPLPAVPEVENPQLLQLTAQQPLRIGADPADATATAAARTVRDILVNNGVTAEVVSTDLPNLASTLLPEGEADVVVSWRHLDDTALSAADTLLCPPRGDSFRAGNLSGYCTPETDAWLTDALTQGWAPADVSAWVERVTDVEHLRLPLLVEQRVAVLGEGIVVPDGELSEWQKGLETAATWRSADTSTRNEQGSIP